MKTYLLLLVALCSFFIPAVAQNKYAGIWQGSISAGGKSVHLVFHIRSTDNKLTGTMDSPDQGVTGIACKAISEQDDSLYVDMTNMGIAYKGKLTDGGIAGTWRQSGLVFPLELKKTDNPIELKRPQTPKQPYPYLSEDVLYENADKSIQYGATITIPYGKGTYPAVLLITGSGPQNRDEELFGHKPFAVLADYLTRRGYIVMRVDDRGIGQTTGDMLNATTADFAKDVNRGIDYLKKRKEVNTKKIGLLGHSEGGLIAPMVASARKDVDFIILMAGPGVKITQLMEEQNAAILEGTDADGHVVMLYGKLYRGMENAILSAKDSTDARNRITLTFDSWKKSTPDSVVEKVGLNTEAARDEYVKLFVSTYNNKWFYYFLSTDPTRYLTKVTCKVLAINGSRDIQVLAKSNLAGIKESLLLAKNRNFTVQELPGLNHLFQECKTCRSTEYGVLEQTIAPKALEAIGNWMDKNVK
ncbi:MAG: alpha/beta fold hydrolase [Taibaiella sp.]|nr:alpha/beta fold hydrolase [Taibaiella sp.]